MGTFGAFNPFPRRFGGAKSRVKIALDDLNEAMGDGFDASNPNTKVYVRNLAIARLIARAWDTGERLSKLWQPMRTTMDVVERWEKILALTPRPDDTDRKRRSRVAEVLSRFGKATTAARLQSLIQAELGEVFVAIEYLSHDEALITVPDGSYPFGTVVDGRPWSSAVAKVWVRVRQPSGWTAEEFYEAVGKIHVLLDPILPAWCDFTWYRPGNTSVAVGGLSAAGFYLDADNNLNEAIFDE